MIQKQFLIFIVIFGSIVSSISIQANETFVLDANVNYIICDLGGPVVKESNWIDDVDSATIYNAIPPCGTVSLTLKDKQGMWTQLLVGPQVRGQKIYLGKCNQRSKSVDCRHVTPPVKLIAKLHCKSGFPVWYKMGCDMTMSSTMVKFE